MASTPVLEIPDLPAPTPDSASFVEDARSGVPPDELEARLAARDGVATRGGYAIQSFDGQTPERNNLGELQEVFPSSEDKLLEPRSVTEEQREVIRQVSQKQGELQETERGIEDTASLLADVLAGKYPPDELEARLAARDGVATRGGYAIQSFDGQTPERNNLGELQEVFPSSEDKLLEPRSVTEEQREVIQFVAQNSADRQKKANSAQASSIALELLGNGTSLDDVTKRAQEAGLDDATTTELQTLFTLRGQVSDDRAKALVIEFIKSGDDKELLEYLEDRRVELADISDTTEMRRSINTLEPFIQSARRLKLRSEFWSQANSPNGGEDPFISLERYEPQVEADRLLVLDLRNDGLALRRDRFITTIYQLISKENPDYQQASILLGAVGSLVAELQDERAAKLLPTIARSTYEGEIDTFFTGLLGQLTIDPETIARVEEQLNRAPLRPPIAGVNFLDRFNEDKAKFMEITSALKDQAMMRELVQLRKRFGDDPDVQGLIEDIIDLPPGSGEDDDIRQALIDELSFLITARRGTDPSQFNQLQSIAIEGLRQRRSAENATPTLDLMARPEKRNIAAVRRLVSRFKASIMPLFETIRGGQDGEAVVSSYIDTSGRPNFVQRIRQLEQQRELTDIERAYMESVELLSVFNPHLIALARERPELTSVYLEEYFRDLDRSTREALTQDVYVPLVQIGLGPNGLASAGELNRSNPELASQTLYIDANDMPGGPFAVPKGLSWDLNSANSLGLSTNNLPELQDSDAAGASVRSAGSPLVSYPGERVNGSDTRNASINVTVDYLLNPDNVSNRRRYPSNVDLARVLQLQSAMLVDQVLLSTRLVRVESVNDGQPGNKRLTIEFTGSSGETVTTTIRTDSLIVSSGLGEPNFGFQLEGSEAGQILAGPNESENGFPILTDTIGAFESLSSPEGKPKAPQGTVVIYGGGNSADVLVEYFGRLFESDNPALNGISKVYVIADQLSARPRYAQINDLRERNGQRNFVELVPGKVGDVRQEADGRLTLLGSDGQPITTRRGRTQEPISADHVIAATGFRPMLDEVFGPLLQEGESLDQRQGLGRISLPANPGFSIGDELLGDPSVVFVGTGSRADFTNPNKLAQLPRDAAAALLRNGAENAVAIGFRTTDTRAVVRLKFAGQEVATSSGLAESPNQPKMVDVDDTMDTEGSVGSVKIVDPQDMPGVRRDLPADSDTLTALLLSDLSNLTLVRSGTRLDPRSPEANQGYRFSITPEGDSFEIIYSASEDTSPPQGLVEALRRAVSQPYFQAYALKALAGRRSRSGLDVRLSFSSGRLRLRDKADGSSDSRTYVEVTALEDR